MDAETGMKHGLRAILRVIQSQWEVWMNVVCVVIVIWMESVSLKLGIGICYFYNHPTNLLFSKLPSNTSAFIIEALSRASLVI